MEFAKLHALGNDFLIVNAGEAGGGRRPLSDLARLFCDRHQGVGADGVVFYQPTAEDPDADYSILIYNADGSKAEMSGNGVRCAAAYLAYSGKHSGASLRLRSVSGIKRLVLEKNKGLSFQYRCSMGMPILDPAKIPARIEGSAGVPVLDYPLAAGSRKISVTLSSMGNPHCSTFWPDLSSAPVNALGPLLETHAVFPRRTNVEFVQVLDRHKIRVQFWERGVGRTLSSGTGSSAACVASVLKNLVESPIQVETELGLLRVEWRQGEELFLSGPADFICSGDYPAGDLQISGM